MDKKMQQCIANNLRYLRDYYDYTQEDVAALLHISRTTYGILESGTKNMRTDLLVRLPHRQITVGRTGRNVNRRMDRRAKAFPRLFPGGNTSVQRFSPPPSNQKLACPLFCGRNACHPRTAPCAHWQRISQRGLENPM